MRAVLKNIYRSYGAWDYAAAAITLACLGAVADNFFAIATKLITGH
jgi:hypothetical protein